MNTHGLSTSGKKKKNTNLIIIPRILTPLNYGFPIKDRLENMAWARDLSCTFHFSLTLKRSNTWSVFKNVWMADVPEHWHSEQEDKVEEAD